MKRPAKRQGDPRTIKQRFLAACSMLLVSAILLTTTSYAWFILSVAPEVTGITTNVGANGSLEIALLNSETRQNLSTIRASAGASLVSNRPEGNETWGNLVDLSDVTYGLGNILLMPARLDVTTSGEGYTVNTGLLAVPTYGYDGRIIELTNNVQSACYADGVFANPEGEQGYGVRAIGTSDAVSVQAAALTSAKTQVTGNTNSANSAASAAMTRNGSGMFAIMMEHTLGEDAFNDTHKASLAAMIADLQASVDYIDSAMRYALVAYAASQLTDEDTFVLARDTIMNKDNTIGEIVGSLGFEGSLPASFSLWVTELDGLQNDLNYASNACAALEGGTYTWEMMREILSCIMNTSGVYINGLKFEELTVDNAMDLLGQDIIVTLAPGSGVLADIADFAGNYNAFITVDVLGEAELSTASDVSPYLTDLAAAIRYLEPAEGGVSNVPVQLNNTYGYALDLAFRCNAPATDLLLQTTPEQRVYDDSTSAATMGGGSFMEFTSTDENFTLEQRLLLMDAIRVGFVDDLGALIGVAKLNITSHTTENGRVKAPLYLYGYEFSEEDGSMIMGERRLNENALTPLTQNVPKAITVLVWLDGDIVDNTMVSSAVSASLGGTLNLQFASSTDLIPARVAELINATTDKADLDMVLEAAKQVLDAGQGTMTTESWNAFVEAYNYAAAVSANESATPTQVYNASFNLQSTVGTLIPVTKDELNAQISEIRTLMGTTDQAARIVVETNGVYQAVDPYTQVQYDNKVGDIYRVDSAKNLMHVGNDVMAPIYDNSSWLTLANTLYEAEAVNMNPDATDAQIDGAITAMEMAKDALERCVVFDPFDMEGTLYYMARSDDPDTYGKWYDSKFNRIVSDALILRLNAYSESAVIAKLEQNDYISAWDEVSTPTLVIQDGVYEDLKDEEAKALHWGESELFTQGMTQYQQTRLDELMVQASGLGLSTAAAEAFLAKPANEKTMAAAQEIINALQTAIAQKVDADAETEYNELMNSDQIAIMTLAISSAKTVEGYDDPAKTELAALRTAVANAETLIAGGVGSASNAAAASAIEALNNQLTANGKKAIGYEDAVQIKLPGSDTEDIVYQVNSPNSTLYLNQEDIQLGSETISATILTENGVVYNAEKNVTIYIPADGVNILDGEAKTETLTVTLSGSKSVSAKLFFDAEKHQDKKVNGAAPTDHTEQVKQYLWASGDTAILTVEDATSEACTIVPVAAGSTTVSLSVVTVQGNTYTAQITVTISE